MMLFTHNHYSLCVEVNILGAVICLLPRLLFQPNRQHMLAMYSSENRGYGEIYISICCYFTFLEATVRFNFQMYIVTMLCLWLSWLGLGKDHVLH